MPRKKKMMTRKEVEDKYIDKERGPTMIYPESSMVIANRIFGPGHNDLGDLKSTRDRLFKRGLPEPGESPLTTVGQEIQAQMGFTITAIHEAYEMYRAQVAHMNEMDRILETCKKRAAAIDGDDNNDSDETDDYDDCILEIDEKDKVRGAQHEWEQGEDPYAQFWKVPALWLNKGTAQARVVGMRHQIYDILERLRAIESYYKAEMQPTRDIDQCVLHSVDNMADLAAYAKGLEEIIRSHEDRSPGTTWLSRDQPGVTFGPWVPWVIHRVYELDERLRDMAAPFELARLVPSKLDTTRMLTTIKELRAELREKLLEIAGLCLPEQSREGFKKELEEQLKEWEQLEPSQTLRKPPFRKAANEIANAIANKQTSKKATKTTTKTATKKVTKTATKKATKKATKTADTNTEAPPNE